MKIDLMVPALRVIQDDSGARVVNALDAENVWRDLVDIPVDDLFSRLLAESRASGTAVDVDTGDAWVRFTPQGRVMEVDAPPVVEAQRKRGRGFGRLFARKREPVSEAGKETAQSAEFEASVKRQQQELVRQRDELQAELEQQTAAARERERELHERVKVAEERARQAQQRVRAALIEEQQRAEVAAATAAAAQAELEDARAQVRAAEEQAAQVSGAASARENELRQELEQARQAVTQEQAHVDDLQRQLCGTEDRLVALEASVGEDAKRYALSETIIAQLREQMDQLQQERARLLDAVDVAQNQARDAAADASGREELLRQELLDGRLVRAAAEDEAAAARRRADELAAELEQRDRDREEALREPVEQLRQARQDLSAAAAQNDELREELKDLRKRAAALESDELALQAPSAGAWGMNRRVWVFAGVAALVLVAGTWIVAGVQRDVGPVVSEASAVAIADASDARALLVDAETLLEAVGTGVSSELTDELRRAHSELESLVERGTTDEDALTSAGQRVADVALTVRQAWLGAAITRGKAVVEASDTRVADESARQGLADLVGKAQVLADGQVSTAQARESIKGIDEAIGQVNAAVAAWEEQQAAQAEAKRREERKQPAQVPAPAASKPAAPKPAPAAPKPAPAPAGRVTNISARVSSSGTTVTISVTLQASGTVSARPSATVGGKTVSLSGPGSWSGSATFTGSVSLPAGNHAWAARSGALVASGSISTH